MDLLETWKITLAQIEVKIDSSAQFKTWFRDTRLLEINGGKAEIGVKNSYTSDWLQKKHHKLIKETLSYVYGKPLEPFYVIDKTLTNLPQAKTTKEESTRKPQQENLGWGNDEPANPNLSLTLRRSNLKEDYSFATYVVGPSNKLAHAAALGVAQKPGQVYNPLFIYGKTGLGKTHLGQAVARHILENDFSKKILYIPSEGFLNDMVKAIKTGKNLEFRQKYRSLDLLIIDDIQFISKWQETQNEFFNTFNELYNDKRQIILISDRPPDQITGIEDRLRSRFQGGITVDIGQPDFEMRMAILENKSQQLGINLNEKVYEYIAKLVEDNIRELEGALQKVNLYQTMFNSDIAYEDVEKILGKDKRSRRNKIKVPQILKRVAKEFNLTVKELKGIRRTEEIAFSRQVCMYILREEFGFKLEQIAHFLERKDHTTVIHAVDKIRSKIMIDEGFKNQMEMLKENIVNENEL
jgi:chromosomal replication initiator protein